MQKEVDKIVEWLKVKLKESGSQGFTIGVSGGVDSALTSTLCAMTGEKVIVLGMPIHQEENQVIRSKNHMQWLCNKFPNVEQKIIDLTKTFDVFRVLDESFSDLALANSRSRLRMLTLYAIANTNNLLVAGTGNKVEDYGIGFFTKYGDGGVDISPIADLLKSEVRNMAKFLEILEEVVYAIPTDGLWGDNRNDEEQIGASYEELEWALKFTEMNKQDFSVLNDRQIRVLSIYLERHEKNQHKLKMPDVCYLK